MNDIARQGAEDPRFMAGLDLLRRTGIREFSIRYSDDEQPTVWMVVGTWRFGERSDGNVGPVATGGELRSDCGGGMTPLSALMRLLDQTIDGGTCMHCRKPTGVVDDFTQTMPLGNHICWYQFDPELVTFRRGCEGETTQAKQQ